jgi:hypothetical protein
MYIADGPKSQERGSRLWEEHMSVKPKQSCRRRFLGVCAALPVLLFLAVELAQSGNAADEKAVRDIEK